MANRSVVVLQVDRLAETTVQIDDTTGSLLLPIIEPTLDKEAVTLGYLNIRLENVPVVSAADAFGFLQNDGFGNLSWVESRPDWTHIQNIPTVFAPDMANPALVAEFATKADQVEVDTLTATVNGKEDQFLPVDSLGFLHNDGTGAFSFIESVDFSEGVDDANKLVRTAGDGHLDASLFPEGLFNPTLIVDTFNPSVTNEYPTGTFNQGDMVVVLLDAPYTLTTGNLAGTQLTHADLLMWGDTGGGILDWIHIPQAGIVGIEPELDMGTF